MHISGRSFAAQLGGAQATLCLAIAAVVAPEGMPRMWSASSLGELDYKGLVLHAVLEPVVCGPQAGIRGGCFVAAVLYVQSSAPPWLVGRYLLALLSLLAALFRF